LIISILIIIIGYIAYSTTFINKVTYRSIAWEAIAQGSFYREALKDSWKYSEVRVINIDKENIAVGSRNWSKFNYHLNHLNGGYAVSVTLRIPGDNMHGPNVIYINPFTKQIIGVQSSID
jgi:hypothetical protein